MTRTPLRRATFEALSSDGIRLKDGPVRVTYLPGSHPAAPAARSLSLAFTLGRRFGTAVERNRARRRLRAAFDILEHSPVGGVALIGATREVLRIPFADLVATAERLVDRMASARDGANADGDADRG